MRLPGLLQLSGDSDMSGGCVRQLAGEGLHLGGRFLRRSVGIRALLLSRPAVLLRPRGAGSRLGNPLFRFGGDRVDLHGCGVRVAKGAELVNDGRERHRQRLDLRGNTLGVLASPGSRHAHRPVQVVRHRPAGTHSSRGAARPPGRASVVRRVVAVLRRTASALLGRRRRPGAARETARTTLQPGFAHSSSVSQRYTKQTR